MEQKIKFLKSDCMFFRCTDAMTENRFGNLEFPSPEVPQKIESGIWNSRLLWSLKNRVGNLELPSPMVPQK